MGTNAGLQPDPPVAGNLRYAALGVVSSQPWLPRMIGSGEVTEVLSHYEAAGSW
jgi:hypothetical protein